MTHSQFGETDAHPVSGGALTHLIDVTRLPSKGLNIKLEPDEDVLAKLAAQCDLLSISEFSANLNVRSWHKDGVRVTGQLHALLAQSCIITLEPVQDQIDTSIEAIFVPTNSKLARPNLSAETGELIVEVEGDDAPELFELPNLDVGAVAAEFFALEINPYPKSPDANEADVSASAHGSETDDDATENPFAALAKIRDKL